MYAKITSVIGVVLAACAGDAHVAYAPDSGANALSWAPDVASIVTPIPLTVTSAARKRGDEYHPRGFAARQNSGASTVTVTSTVMSTVATSTATVTTTLTNETTARASSTTTVTSTVTGNPVRSTTTVTSTVTSMATRRTSAATATSTVTTSMTSSPQDTATAT